MYTLSDAGLCCPTLLDADFRTLAECAGGEGLGSITISPHFYERAREQGLSDSDLRLILEDNGVSISELDPLVNWTPHEIPEDNFASGYARYTEYDFYRIADGLGARTINAIHTTDDPLDSSALADSLAALCERAAAHDLIVTVEPMPWSTIGNLETALDLVARCGQSNCGVNVDTWHLIRSGGSVADLRKLQPGMVEAIQLSDVAAEPWEDVFGETARGRCLPGEGVGDSVGAMCALYEVAPDVPVNIEVFSDPLRKLPSHAAAAAMATSTKNVFEQAALENR